MAVEVKYLTLEAGKQQIADPVLHNRVLWVSVEGSQYNVIYTHTLGNRQAYHLPIQGRMKFLETADQNRTVAIKYKS